MASIGYDTVSFALHHVQYIGNWFPDLCFHRCSLMGFDLNRHWVDPSPWAHPTLYGIKQLIIQMHSNPVSEQWKYKITSLFSPIDKCWFKVTLRVCDKYSGFFFIEHVSIEACFCKSCFFVFPESFHYHFHPPFSHKETRLLWVKLAFCDFMDPSIYFLGNNIHVICHHLFFSFFKKKFSVHLWDLLMVSHLGTNQFRPCIAAQDYPR